MTAQQPIPLRADPAALRQAERRSLVRACAALVLAATSRACIPNRSSRPGATTRWPPPFSRWPSRRRRPPPIRSCRRRRCCRCWRRRKAERSMTGRCGNDKIGRHGACRAEKSEQRRKRCRRAASPCRSPPICLMRSALFASTLPPAIVWSHCMVGWLGRPSLHSYLGPGAGARASLPDQSIWHDV